MASSPLRMKSKRVRRFSGVGADTKMLLYPSASAPEMASPSAALLPRPRDAVSATVLRSVFSEAASRKVTTARAWSSVLHMPTRPPAGSVSLSDSTSSASSAVAALCGPPSPSAASGWMSFTRLEVGRMLSSSSIMMQLGVLASDSTMRSLKRPTTSWCDSVRRRAWQSMVRSYSLVREVSVESSITTMPPPSTVSMVRASRLGVSASKSCSTHMPKVLPRILCVSA
mmetsp:Transcript_13210/g.33443  ORF Transcript_13210/g.33443 Transcript_13210/m.33443 type:complete len:227 (-) Transcript_13210:343-1023(-)